MQALPQPLGFGNRVYEEDVQNALSRLRLRAFPSDCGRAYDFYDVISSLGKDLRQREGQNLHGRQLRDVSDISKRMGSSSKRWLERSGSIFHLN